MNLTGLRATVAFTHWGKRGCERTDQVCIRKHEIPEIGILFCPVSDSGRLDDIAYTDIRRTGYFTSLAVHAVFQGRVEKVRLLQPETFAVRTGPVWVRDSQD